MNGDTLYSIGDLARRTGLTVKTIRFYSDSGIVPPTDRSPTGYRLYDIDALARLDLVRTLRDLGLDLAAVRQVLDREVSLPRSPRHMPKPWRCRSAPCGSVARYCERWPGVAPPLRRWT